MKRLTKAHFHVSAFDKLKHFLICISFEEITLLIFIYFFPITMHKTTIFLDKTVKSIDHFK